jgi:hypothetical protein
MKDFSVLLIKALCGNSFSKRRADHLGKVFGLSKTKQLSGSNISIHKLRGR